MFEIVKEIIDFYDPYGLLAMHAPKNEYDIESRKIADKINENSNADEIAAIISDVFTSSFSHNFLKKNFIEAAIKIKSIILKNHS